MKVLHIDRQRGWTGQTNRTLNLVRGLGDLGIETELVAHRGGALAEHARDRQARCHELPLYGSAAWASLAPLMKLLRAGRFDILHCHGPRDHLLAACCRVGRAVPHLIRTRHNHIPLNSPMSRWLFRPCDAVDTVSQFVCDLTASEGIRVPILRTIHTAVDTDRFSPRPPRPDLAAELGIGLDRFIIGHVSTLDPRKAVDVLIRGFAKLRAAHPGTPMQLVLVGKATGKWQPLVRELGLEADVLFTGFRRDVPQILPLLDVYVLSSHAEALGTAIVEAMSAGLPVIGSRTGGMPEAVGEDAGLLVEPGDERQLHDALEHMLQNPDARARMAAAARQRAVEHFSIDTMIQGTARLYHDVLAR